MGAQVSQCQSPEQLVCLERKVREDINWDDEPCNLQGDDKEQWISIRSTETVASKNILGMKGNVQKMGQMNIGRFELGKQYKTLPIGDRMVQLIVEGFLKKKEESLKFKTLPINISKFIQLRGQPIEDNFTFLQEIGEGSYGTVYRAKSLHSEDLRAIKKIKKEKISEKGKANLVNEFNLLKKLDHPNIIKLYEMYEDQQFFYVVTEICEGGSLLDFTSDFKLSDTVMKCITMQLMSALNYLHDLNILHRDIKLENIVLVQSSKSYLYSLPQIKIIDFGVSMKLTAPRNDEREALQGSLMYMPPQALTGQLSLSWDVWSLGILLFIMITGKLPYKATNIQELATNILSCNIEWKYTKKIDRETRNILKRCLTKDWTLRPSTSTLKQDSWLKERKEPPLSQSKRRQTIINLVNFQKENNMLSFIKSYLSSKKTKQMQRQRLAQIFNSIDTNKDGRLSIAELKQFCRQNGEFYYQQEIQQIFKSIDTNLSNKIEFNEFIVMMQKRSTLFDKQSMEQAFDLFDLTKTGQISKNKMRQALAGIQTQEIDYLFKKLDSDGNDIISKEEFIQYLAGDQQ